MAKKGQIFRRYELAFKQQVLQEYRQGSSYRSLSRKYDIPEGTIITWSQIEKKYGGLGIAKRGTPKGTPYKDYRERYEILKKFQDFLDNKEPKKR